MVVGLLSTCLDLGALEDMRLRVSVLSFPCVLLPFRTCSLPVPKCLSMELFAFYEEMWSGKRTGTCFLDRIFSCLPACRGGVSVVAEGPERQEAGVAVSTVTCEASMCFSKEHAADAM